MDERRRDLTLEPPQWRILADRLGFGLLRRVSGSPRAENGIMAAFSAEYGVDVFATTEDRIVRLRNPHGRMRRFQIWFLEDAWLVQELHAAMGRRPAVPPALTHPILWLSASGGVREANAAAGELMSYLAPEGELSARLITELSHADREGESNFDLMLNGRIFEFSLMRQGNGFELMGAEVTERRYAEAQLRQKEARLRALLEAAPDAIVTVAPDGRVDFVNPPGEQMFGYKSGQLRDAAIETLVPEWFFIPQVLALFEGEESACTLQNVREPFQGARMDGSLFPIEISASALDRDGTIYVTAIIRDVTDRENATREIRALNDHLENHIAQLTELNGELEAFSYSVSHDLRGPLRSIDGFSAILSEEYVDRLDAEGREFLARIRAATGRMSDLIDGLLRLGRITRAELRRECVDLSAVAHFVADGLQRDAPQRCAEFLIEEGVVAEGDRALLTVVMENLLNNAWKFTGQRPCARIVFDTEVREGERVFRVSDNGTGFDMSYAAKLFRPFERLHAAEEFPGTGIGLATVQRVIRRHGGEVWAIGRPGEGATFCFTLGQC